MSISFKTGSNTQNPSETNQEQKWIKSLEKTGELKQLQEYIKTRLTESGWRNEVSKQIQATLSKQNVGMIDDSNGNNLAPSPLPLNDGAIEELVDFFETKISGSIPNTIRKDLDLHLQRFARSEGFDIID